MPLRRLSQAPPGVGQYAPIGAMNRQVNFCTPGGTNSSDGTLRPPAFSFSSWAALYALAGAELDKAQQIAQRVSHLVVINYPGVDVNSNMLIEYLDGGNRRLFQIAQVEDPDERRVQLKIYAFEVGQNAGAS